MKFALALIGIVCSGLSAPNAGNDIAGVQRVYVNPIPDTPGRSDLRSDLIAALRKHSEFKVVDSADQADAVLDGKVEIWVQGYYSLNPRIRTVAAAQAVYRGYLSVELKRNDETVWSYLATPHSSTSQGIRKDLADQVVKKLSEAVTHARP